MNVNNFECAATVNASTRKDLMYAIVMTTTHMMKPTKFA